MTEHLIVASGKGGVGKSTISVALAEQIGAGILDVDLMAPNVPEILGGQPDRPMIGVEGKNIKPAKHNEFEVMSLAYELLGNTVLMKDDNFELEIVKEWCSTTLWDSEIVVVDTPPGTDRPTQTVMETIGDAYALIVTTGQGSSIRDCKRTIEMMEHMNNNEGCNIEILGVVENMHRYDPPQWIKTLVDNTEEGELPENKELKLFGANNIQDHFDYPVVGRIPYTQTYDETLEEVGAVVDEIEESILVEMLENTDEEDEERGA